MNCREIVLYIRSCQENDCFRRWCCTQSTGWGGIAHSCPRDAQDQAVCSLFVATTMCKIKSTQLTPGLPLGISPLHNGLHTQQQHLGTNSTGTTTKRLQLGTLKPP